MDWEDTIKRTAAMKAFLVAYLVVLAILVLFLLNVLGVLPIIEVEAEGQVDPSAFALPLAVFGVLVVLVIVAGATWSRAPRTSWFWLVGAIPGLLFFLPDIPIIVGAVTSPGSALEALLAIAVTGVFVVLLVSAILSFRDARRLTGTAAP